VGEPLRLPNRLRPAREEGLDDRGDGLRWIARHLVYQPDAERDVGSETLARQEPAPGRPGPDLREDERRDDGGNDPQPNLREPEHRLLGRDRDVGARDEAAAAAERVAVNLDHHRSRAAVDRLAHPEEPEGVLDVLLVGKVDRGALPLDVGAGAEVLALTGEDYGTRVPDIRECVGELPDESRVERVTPLRTRQGDLQDGAVPLDRERAHGRELKVGSMIKGALAAALTPLREDGAALDEDAFGPYLDFLADGGLDGILALGTTGEGILLSVEERKRVTEHFLAASRGRLQIAVHCGAQTTGDTVALAEHSAAKGVDGVAVIGPPYFRLDAEALFEHFRRAASACAPTPFYLYEFEATSGYPIPLEVIERLRAEVPNLAGLKVSDSPFEKVKPYLLEGLDVFVGAEALLAAGLAGGAAGAVSGLAAAYPEEVAAVVRAPSADGAARLGELRAAIERFPRHAALKLVVGSRGVPLREDVRAPLRRLTAAERNELLAWLG
jgi:dihydrodipicolinate synthase/N-acetylneuraminate lyase